MPKNSFKRIASRIKAGLRQKQISRQKITRRQISIPIVVALIGVLGPLMAALGTLLGSYITEKSASMQALLTSNATIRATLEENKTQMEMMRQTEANKFKLQKTKHLETLFNDIIENADKTDTMVIKAKIEALGIGGREALNYLITLREFYKNKDRRVIEGHVDKTIHRILLSGRTELAGMRFGLKDSNNALYGRGRCNRADFSNCDLSKADFDGCMLVAADFTNSILEGTSFKGAILAHANFRAADLSEAIFGSPSSEPAWKTDVKNADFRSTILDGVSFRDVINLEAANFSPDMLVTFSVQRQQNRGPFAGVDSGTLEKLYNNHIDELIDAAKKEDAFLQQIKQTQLWQKLNLSVKLQ